MERTRGHGTNHQKGYSSGHMVYSNADPIANPIAANDEWKQWSWISEGVALGKFTIQNALRTWTIVAMALDRGLTFEDVGNNMDSTWKKSSSVTRQRVAQMLREATYNGSDLIYFRIEEAISRATEARGGVYAAVGYSDTQQLANGLREWVGIHAKDDEQELS